MTSTIQTVTILLVTTILITGGVVPYSFANNYDEDYDETEDDYQCEIPSKFHVKYNGESGSSVELYKKPRQAANSDRMLYDFNGQTFNDGDIIELDAEAHLGIDHLKKKTTFKVIKSDGTKAIIAIDTSCNRPLSVGDTHEKNGVVLTVMGGWDKHGDDVIYDDYYHHDDDKNQECVGTPIVFGGELEHGSSMSAINNHLQAAHQTTLTVSANNLQFNNATIFDSSKQNTADPDLEVNKGNLAIIAENINDSDNDGLIDSPDDSAHGGTQTYMFDIPQTVFSFRWVDLDYGETATATAFDVNDNVVGSVNVHDIGVGNGKSKIISFDEPAENVKKLVFDYSSSGGITDICKTEFIPPVTDVSITLNKEIVGGTETDPDAFGLSVTTLGVEYPINSGIEAIFPHGDGLFTINEGGAPNYQLDTISCNNHPEVNTLPFTLELQEGESLVCDIVNKFVEPTQITLFNSVTTDNGLPIPDETEFGLTIDGASAQFASTVDVQAEQEITITMQAPEGFSRVLVIGSGCPTANQFELNGGSVTVVLSQGEQLVCTIYHDDNGEGADGVGVIFHFDTQIFEATNDGFQDPTVGTPCTDWDTFQTNNVNGKCVERDGTSLTIVPDLSQIPQELTDTTIVVFTVIPDDSDINSANAQFSSDCIFTGLGSSLNDDNLGFKLFCSDMSDDNFAGDGVKFNVNYALIETTMG